MEKEELCEVHISHSETFKMVFMGVDEVRYEGGWWMKRGDYNKLFRMYPNWGGHDTKQIRRRDIGISRDENTKQLTIFIIPTREVLASLPPIRNET